MKINFQRIAAYPQSRYALMMNHINIGVYRLKTSPVLYGLDEKIEDIYQYCKIFTKNEVNSTFSKLSVYPTFLFDGYPGTGKSSVASIVYEKLKENCNIDLKRLNIDELISHNFGESSSNLREFFKNIKTEIAKNDSYCFIIMDEVDSFTISRYQNDNESIKRILLTFNTIIDELVRTDEIYRYIIVATTNLKESIDTSVLRRFYFKEDFNVELGFESFKEFINELCNLAEIKVDETSLIEIHKVCLDRKYTLGEIKSVLSRVYVNNLVSTKEQSPLLTTDCFRKYKTFHEITLKQIGGTRIVD